MAALARDPAPDDYALRNEDEAFCAGWEEAEETVGVRRVAGALVGA